jgi:phage head maturation protease
VRRGDYSGCSFEFWPEDYDVQEREGGKDVKITHKKFRALTALTIGMDPAYKQTSVNARELYDETPSGKKAKADAEEQRKREEQEKADALQREMNRRLVKMKRIESTVY